MIQSRQRFKRVVCCYFSYLRQFQPTDFRQNLCNPQQLIGAVAAIPAQPLRWNIRRIGLQHDGLDRQNLCQLADIECALVGHGAAKAQFETQPDELVRLLLATVEGMRDAAGDPVSTQMFENNVCGSPHVQDDRQIQGLCQLELLTEVEFLARTIVALNEKIQPDFADRDSAGHLQSFTQVHHILRHGVIDIHWVDAERMRAMGKLPRERLDIGKIAPVHGRHHDQSDTLRQRRLRHRRAVSGKLCRIKMTVSIDQHSQAPVLARTRKSAPTRSTESNCRSMRCDIAVMAGRSNMPRELLPSSMGA